MSTVGDSVGSARKASQLQLCRSPVSLVTVNSHLSRSTRGVGPADSTGKSSTRYCPGGRLAVEGPRLPLNPGDTLPIVHPFQVRLRTASHAWAGPREFGPARTRALIDERVVALPVGGRPSARMERAPPSSRADLDAAALVALRLGDADGEDAVGELRVDLVRVDVRGEGHAVGEAAGAACLAP